MLYGNLNDSAGYAWYPVKVLKLMANTAFTHIMHIVTNAMPIKMLIASFQSFKPGVPLAKGLISLKCFVWKVGMCICICMCKHVCEHVHERYVWHERACAHVCVCTCVCMWVDVSSATLINYTLVGIKARMPSKTSSIAIFLLDCRGKTLTNEVCTKLYEQNFDQWVMLSSAMELTF